MKIVQKNSLSLIYAIILGLMGMAIIALIAFPLNEAWLFIKNLGTFSTVDAATLGFMGDIIRWIPVAITIAFVVGLFTTAQFQKNEAY